MMAKPPKTLEVTFMASPTPQLGFREVLAIAAVRRIWIAQIVSVFGDFLAIFAVISVVTFRLHGTPTEISLILVSYMLPLAFISPFAGVYVDKWNVRRTMIASDLIRAVLILCLPFLQGNLIAIYAIFFSLSIVSAFFVPAQSVAVRTIAPPTGLLSVNGLMSQAVQGSIIIAPALAGILVDGIGANACFVLDGASFCLSAALIFSLTIERHRGAAPPAAVSVLTSMRQGFSFIFNNSTIAFVMIAMTSGMFAMRCFGALLSVYVRDILVSSGRSFGILNALIGVGMITGTQSLHRFARGLSQQHLIIYGIGGMSASVFITAVIGTIPSTAAGMLGLGFSAAFVMVTSQTLIQRETPHEILGRAISSMMSLMAISQVAAMLFAGSMAQAVGIRNLYLVSGAMLATIGIVGYRKLQAREVPA